MDTKLKNNKSKYIISGIISLLLIILSIGMYSIYPLIKDQAKEYEHNIFQEQHFLINLNNSNYNIYYDTLKNKDNDILKPSDILINELKKYNKNDEENNYFEENRFNEDIYRYGEILDRDLKNLEYYAINKDNKLFKQRNQGAIDSLLLDNPDSTVIEELNNKYSFYIVIDYNENGEMTVNRIYGADKLITENEIKNNRKKVSDRIEIKPIKNMTYIYAVPNELKYKDFISTYNLQNRIQSYNKAASNYIYMAIGLILIVGLIISYRFLRELIGFRKLIKIPIEISALIAIFTIAIVLYESSYSMISGTLEGNLINLDPIVLNDVAINLLENIINILFWTISFGIIFVVVVLLKHILKTGIKKYLQENSLIYKGLRSIWRGNKKVYNYLSNVDLKSKENKKIVALLGINLTILTIMSSLWFLGIVLAIIYTLVLLRLIKKYYNDISSKYNKLFEATSNIAEGNLDINIGEDLGIFNNFKVELQNIQKGFKKAVNEEVKSQRMKAELITNVSHDLKTPLTAIITYVDLLKDDKISVEKRGEYLDTLDRKSQRLKELIEDLFEVSKATSGNINLNIEDVDIVSLIKQTLLEVEYKITEASLILKTNYPKEKVILPLDSQRMFRVFENLLINITKYSLKGSRVYIDVINNTDNVQVILKNMAANEINFNVNEIMERFVRGDKSRNTEGSGLGLAIAKSFVDIQGGKLDIVVDGDLFKVIITFNK
ncbi:histidine kinase dimerization/phospho-acceptor domain-containing protein [Clostridium intestinale]|uniref:histidine kinase n=1 Tax=Clostridium intestinale URNW TaxID=1294142 RepID=U2NQ30_9CLOT|nr:histidine kinase dimerization/phospho-acceptor domain-containing protein [Clostridium intestinale]ERK30966.1 sensor histidine kinase [Clostridium intestinale URNW]